MSPRRGATDSSDRGSATIWLLALSSLVALVVAAGVVRGVATVGRHRVESAADLAALAGAQRVLYGPAAVCAEVGRVASGNGVSVTRCAVSADIVDVIVRRPIRIGRLGSWVASAEARAGPVTGADVARSDLVQARTSRRPPGDQFGRRVVSSGAGPFVTGRSPLSKRRPVASTRSSAASRASVAAGRPSATRVRSVGVSVE